MDGGLMTADLTDEALVERFRRGDAEGFAELVRRYFGSVCALLFRRTGDRHRAEELTQEAFLQAYRRQETFDAGRRFRPWLYAIALNAARADGRRRTPPVGSLDAGESGPAPDPADPAEGPETSAEQGEMSRLVRRAVESLPEAQQDVILLALYQGLSYPEAAEVLGRPVGTIKSLMHYAVKALRRKLEPVRRRMDE
jgi:RNA polymerase sigma-70 factor (ECF subfamily)